MIKAICKWFRDVFGPLTADEQIACVRDNVRGYGNSRVYDDASPRLNIAYLRAEIVELQGLIDQARARHQKIAHLRRILARRMGELLVAVSP